MKKYNIEIEELLQRVIEIEAETKEKALMIAREMYRNEEIILDSEDLKSITFE